MSSSSIPYVWAEPTLLDALKEECIRSIGNGGAQTTCDRLSAFIPLLHAQFKNLLDRGVDPEDVHEILFILTDILFDEIRTSLGLFSVEEDDRLVPSISTTSPPHSTPYF